MPLANIPLPDRAVSIKGDVISVPSAYYWSIPVLLVITVVFLVWQTPSLLRDITISQHPVTLQDASIENGKCQTHRGIFTDCEAHLAYDYQGHSYQTDLEMFFVDFHVGDYQTGVVISGDKPELATLSIGVDKLWNRMISLTVLVLLLGSIVVGMIFLMLRVWRVRGQLLRPDRLAVVPVEITAFNKNRRGFAVTYTDKIARDKTGRASFTQFRTGEEPLLVGVSKDKKAVALAVRHGSTALPVLLDSQLQRIELTPQERAAALAVTGPVTASAPSLAAFAAQKKGRPWLRGLVTFFGMILLIIVAAIGYWLWYVTSADSQFNSPGMDINNIMPAPLNEWGCAQLKKRFGNDRAPFGCVAGDYTSWK